MNRRARRRHAAIESAERKRLIRENERKKSAFILLRGEEWKEVAIPILISYLRLRVRTQEVGEYCIVSKVAEAEHSTIEGNSIVWDAPSGLILACNGFAVGCIGFSIVGKRVIVSQIQGRKGQEAHLRVFNWDLMLLDVVVALATTSGFQCVEVRPAYKNKWFKIARHRSFLHLYDGNARKLGFAEPNKGNFNFLLKLT